MPPWASSTSRLRWGCWTSISSWSMAAPRSDMFSRSLSLTGSGTPRRASTRSFWLASRSTCWIARSSSWTMSSKTNSMRRTSSARSWSVAARWSSTLRSVGRSAWLRIWASALAPPAAEYSCSTTAVSFLRTTSSTCWITAGLVSPMRAMRSAMSGCRRSGRRASTCAESTVCRLAITSAIVCGDSARRNATICSGGVRRRNSKGRLSITVERRASSSSARSAPSARSSTSRANSIPPATSPMPSARVASASSPRIASVVSSSTEPIFAISSESPSISSSRRCWMISAARSGPSAAISTAALRRPARRATVRTGSAPSSSEAAGSSMAIRLARRCCRRSGDCARLCPGQPARSLARSLILLHPATQLLGDALGAALGELLDLAAHGIAGACARGDAGGCRRERLGRPRRVFALQLGEPDRQLELAQPRRCVIDRFLLAAAQRAGGEEQEDRGRDADQRVLGVAEHPARGSGGGGGYGLGEGHLANRDRVAALGLDARGVGDGFLDRGHRGGGDGVVEQHRDVLAFHRAGGDRGVGDGLVDAERGGADFVLVVGLARGAGLGVGRDVGGAGRAAAGPAAVAGERFEVLGLLQGHPGLAIGERFLSGLIGVERRVDLHLGLAGTERLREHRIDVRLGLLVVAFFGGLFVARAGGAFAVLG